MLDLKVDKYIITSFFQSQIEGKLKTFHYLSFLNSKYHKQNEEVNIIIISPFNHTRNYFSHEVNQNKRSKKQKPTCCIGDDTGGKTRTDFAGLCCVCCV